MIFRDFRQNIAGRIDFGDLEEKQGSAECTIW